MSPAPGSLVRFSAMGADRVRSMPEAWGLHTALQREETGQVLEAWSVGEDPDREARLDVEFPSGSVYGWPAAAFEVWESEELRCHPDER